MINIKNLNYLNAGFAILLAAIIPISVAATNVVDVILLLSCMLYAYLNKDKRNWAHPISLAALILVGVYLISSLHSIGSNTDVSLAIRKISRLMFIPLLLPIFLQEKNRNLVMLSFLAAILVTVLIAFFRDGYSMFQNTIFTSLFVAYAIFMLSHMSLEYPKYRIAAGLLAAIFTYYLFFQNIGRIGQLLFFILYGLFVAQKFKFNIKKILLSTGVLLGFFVLLMLTPNSFNSRYRQVGNELNHYHDDSIEHTSSSGVRLMLFTNSWQLIKQKPIIGFGTGSFTNAYAKFAPPDRVDRFEVRSNPHNQYLLTWVETGLIGLLTLFLFLFICTLNFFRSDSLEGKLGVGLMVSLAAGCLVNSWLLDFTSCHFFVLFISVFTGKLLSNSLKVDAGVKPAANQDKTSVICQSN